MAALKVEVYQKEKVRPSSPTPESLRIHKLSLLDILAGTFYSPFIFFYAGPRRHDYDELKESLSKTLSVLYPFAGRLRGDGSAIQCNDEGADFVRANVTNCDLAEFLKHPKLEHLRQLLPLDPYPNAIDPAQPMLAIQVNRFRCGGTAVAFCIWHAVADGGAMMGLFNTLAAINKGATNSGGGLVVDTTAIFPPGNFDSSLIMPQAVERKLKNWGKYTAKRFIFSKQDMERIKNQYNQLEHRHSSRVEALSVFIWAAVIRATLLANPIFKTYMLTHVVNLRKKLNPPLPSQCLGNINQVTAAKWEADGANELVTARSLVGRVVEAIDKVTNDYVREMHMEGRYLKAILAGSKLNYDKDEFKILSISSLCKFPCGELDIEWGKPIWFWHGSYNGRIGCFLGH